MSKKQESCRFSGGSVNAEIWVSNAHGGNSYRPVEHVSLVDLKDEGYDSFEVDLEALKEDYASDKEDFPENLFFKAVTIW